MKKKFVSTLLVLGVMSTCLLSACGSKPASELCGFSPQFPWIRSRKRRKKKERSLPSECRMTGQTGKAAGKVFQILTVWNTTTPT